MAQVDILNYFSILFWFFIFFSVFYYINYSFLIPAIHSVAVTRLAIFSNIVRQLKIKFNYFYKYDFILNFGNFSHFNFLIKVYIYIQ